MTYSSGSLILDDDYNIFATGNAAGTGDNNVPNINTAWGAGTGNKGYGQTSTISPVSAGSTITATQWATLLTRMTSLANHQNTTITAISNPSTGDTITAYAALDSNITAVFNSRLNAVANGTDASTVNSTTSSWSSSATLTKTFTWAGANQLRYFFNAGGQIRFSLSRTGGTASPHNTGWSNLLTATGTLVYTGSGSVKTIAGTSYTGFSKVGGSGTPTIFVTGTGVQDLTPGGAATTVFRQFDTTYLYQANYVTVTAALNATSTVLTLVITLTDAYTGGVNPDTVDGTLSATFIARPPSTTYLTDTWGTVTQNTPTWSLA